MPYSFPQTHRLKTKNDFQTVFDKPIRVNHRCLSVLIRFTTTSLVRIGIIVSKRVAKQAVIRNRIKRIIRESFRLQQPGLSGADIIVIARSECRNMDKKSLREVADSLWQKLIALPQR